MKEKVGDFKYLRGVCDAGSGILFNFRSGTHGLNKELGRHREREGLGRHRGRESKMECSLCGDECVNVSQVSAYSSTRVSFMKKLHELLENNNEDFESLET